MITYDHLDCYSNWVDDSFRQQPLFPKAKPGLNTIDRIRDVLGYCNQPEEPMDVQLVRKWEKDGLYGEELSWQVGYGPRTHAWLFKPAKAEGRLPGVLALHDHGGFKYYGKEKIAEGPDSPRSIILEWFSLYYGGRAWANALARRGFLVLVSDTFLWGSRRFPIETIEKSINLGLPDKMKILQEHAGMDEVAWYNFLASHHEHLVAKYCNLLGTCLAGVVAHEDRIALNYLRSRHDVDPENLACLGLSGGGNRSVLLRATAEGLKAAGVVGLMSTYPALLDHNIATHTWMFFPTNWSRYGDWPDIAACQAPLPLLVQYDTEDDLFTLEGMQDAHERILDHYTEAKSPTEYTGQFYPGPHKFDLEMQEAAFGWLEKNLK